jgi:hypothetical protein
MTTKTLEAKFAGKCAQCPTRIQPGDPILWDGTGSTRHVECPAPAEVPELPAGPTRQQILAKVHALLLGARSTKLRWPKVRLQTIEGRDIKLCLSKFKSDDCVRIYHCSESHGRIDADGEWLWRNHSASDVETAVLEFGKNPESVARVYGRMTSSCCFCGRSLSDRRSTQIGYGPICADHYNLPWGEAPAPVEEAKVDQPASENCFEDSQEEPSTSF